MEEALLGATFFLGSVIGPCPFQHIYLDGDEARGKTAKPPTI